MDKPAAFDIRLQQHEDGTWSATIYEGTPGEIKRWGWTHIQALDELRDDIARLRFAPRGQMLLGKTRRAATAATVTAQ